MTLRVDRATRKIDGKHVMRAVRCSKAIVIQFIAGGVLLCGGLACWPAQGHAINLAIKLNQRATFLPEKKCALDQLIEVARHYEIPMGIEWLEEQSSRETPTVVLRQDGTVLDLLKAIVQLSPKHHLQVQDRIVHIAPDLAGNPTNPLNLRIDHFKVGKANLFAAEDQLRLAIDMTLHPQEYEEGYIQSYGFPHDSVFTVRNVTFSGSKLTVREILDGLAIANGNALWVTRLDYLKLTAQEEIPKPVRNPSSVEPPSPPLWRFIPLRGEY
jgi:hypothetical protein